MTKKNALSKAVKLAILGISAASLMPVSAIAQESGAIEEVTVTGSRIKRADLENAAPISVIGSEAIEMSGVANVADLVMQLPAVTGSTNTTRGGSPTSSINLRGLPGSATLVLINGRRGANAADTGDVIDLNAIPPAAIERVEVLKDGASAVYGADAVAGVVNIILKNDFEGVHFDVDTGKAADEGGDRTSFNLLMGSSTEKASFTLGANYFEQDRIYSRDRKASANTPIPSSAIPPGRATVPGFEFDTGGNLVAAPGESAVAVLRDGAAGGALADYRPFGASDPYNYQAATTENPDQQRFSIFGSARVELNDNLEINMELIHSDTEIVETWAYAPIFSAFEAGDFTWSANNIHNPFGVDVSDWRRRMTDSGLPRFFDHQVIFDRAVISLDGQFSNDWDWSASYMSSQSRYNQTFVNVIDKNKLALAVGDNAVCAAVDGCVQMNPLAPPGEMPDEQWQYVMTDVQMRGELNVRSYHFDVTGDLFETSAGAVGFAAGAEYRKESYSKEPDGLIAEFKTIGGANEDATGGNRDVSELYAEALVPVTDDLDLTFAVRYSDFSDFGKTTNPKVGVEWSATETLTVRATYSTGFRAPNLTELYRGGAESFDFLSDPCAAANAGSTSATAGCSQQSDPDLFQFRTVTTGNAEDLEAEESTSYTFGVVWQSEAIDGLNLHLDYFNILQENAIDNPKQYFIDQNAEGGPLGDRVQRDVNGNITQVDVTYINLAEREVSGIDFGGDYSFDTGLGTVSIGAEMTWLEKYDDQAHPEADVIDRVGTYDNSSNAGMLPEYKASGYVGINADNWNAQLRAQWNDDVIDMGNGDADVDSYTRFDLSANYMFADGMKIGFGVDNIFDEDPSFVGSEPEGYDANTHDIQGRYMYLKLSVDM